MKKFARLLGLVVAISAVLMMVAVAGACDHVWTVWTTKVDPTCLKEGLQESSCDKPNCGKHAYRAVAKLDHLYVPATCTQRSTVSMVAMMKEESYSRILLRLQPAYSVLNARSAALKRGRLVDTILYRQAVCSLKYAQSVLFRQKN